MKLAIAYSHIDARAALRLLCWIHHLGGKNLPLVVVATQMATRTKPHEHIQNLLKGEFPNHVSHVAKTQDERGWPRSATHLFIQSLHFCAGDDMFWLEPDALPIRRGWYERLVSEYRSSKKTFMGRLIPEAATHPDHMSGIGIYGRKWCETVPQLGVINENAMGAWDVDCAPWILRDYHNTKRIQHRWVRHLADRRVPVDVIDAGTDLFHQDKTGQLPYDLDPSFADNPLTTRYGPITLGNNMTTYFLNQRSDAPLALGGKSFAFEKATYLNGSWFGTLASSDPEELALLEAACATGRIKEISKEDYDKYEVKKKTETGPKNSFGLPNLTESLQPKPVASTVQPVAAAPKLSSADAEAALTPRPTRGRR